VTPLGGTGRGEIVSGDASSTSRDVAGSVPAEFVAARNSTDEQIISSLRRKYENSRV
jgi:hypothetical protein